MSKTSNTTLINNPCLELNNQGQILRLQLLKQQHKIGSDGNCADFFPKSE